MKKIKKLSLLTIKLSPEKMKEVKGGACSADFLTAYMTFPWDGYGYLGGGGNPPQPHCKCGCHGCAYQDGGAGFSVGMYLENLDGYSCTWNSIM